MNSIVFGVLALLAFACGILIERFRRTASSDVARGMLFSICFWAAIVGLVVGAVMSVLGVFINGFAFGTLFGDLGLGLAAGLGGVLAGSCAQQLLWKALGR
jgi:hypothetical protein